jgi:zinc/manganese transport system substrate-binding protein
VKTGTRWRWFAAAALLGLAAACGGAPAGGQSSYLPDLTVQPISGLSPVELGAKRPLRVVVTTSMVAEPAAAVGGDLIDLTVLIPRGSDPHEYQPAPRDAVSLSGADVVLASGLGYETFLGKLMGSAGADTPVVSLSEGIQPLAVGGGEMNGGTPLPGEVNPHVWLNPQNVITWADNAAGVYAGLDPAQEQTYRDNAKAYIDRLRRLDAWAESQLGGLVGAHRNLVADHAVLDYLAQRYGLGIVATIRPEASDLGEPSARQLADLEDQLRSLKVHAIFVGVYDNHALADQVGQDLGIPVVPLYLESLSPPDGPAGTYEDMIRYDVAAMVEALK